MDGMNSKFGYSRKEYSKGSECNNPCEQIIGYHMSISHKIRTVLFVWLMEVSSELKLYSESFEVAVILIDEYIKKDLENTITEGNLQILGLTCLWIAIKINEDEKSIPTIEELSEITGIVYTKKFLEMEYKILENLNWNVYRKSPYYYVEKLSSKFNISELIDKSKEGYDKVFNLIDMTYLEYDFIVFPPKIISSAVLKILYKLNYENNKHNIKIMECVKRINKFCTDYKSSVSFMNADEEGRAYYHQRCYECKLVISKQLNIVAHREITVNRQKDNSQNSNRQLRILGKCGEGTYSVVYRGAIINKGIIRNKKKMVTIKKYRKGGNDLYGIEPSTIAEISFLKKCDHPNIISLNEIIYQSDQICIVYDYCKSTLYDVLNGKRQLVPSQIRKYIYQILLGLEHCHSKHIIHADIKPQNILLKNDQVKICDFNCSKLSYSYCKPPQMVTLWYRSPELLLGSVNYKTEIDIWSAGCVLAEMYLGYVLFPGISIDDQIQKIFKKFGTPENSELGGFPRYKQGLQIWPQEKIRINNECDDLLSKMLEMEPSKRITVKDALEHNYFNDLHNK